MPDQRITCPRPHANHLLFSLTAGGDIAVKCRGCHEVYVISWAELEAKRRAALACAILPDVFDNITHCHSPRNR